MNNSIDHKQNVFRPNKLGKAMGRVLLSGLVPYIVSAPGIGKSSITHSVADKNQLELIDVRLAQVDPTELNGFPAINEKTDAEGNTSKVASYIPMDIFPLEDTPLPKGKQGWLLFLDELPAAPPATQAAAYKLILDRKVGNRKLHDNVYIVAAGNDTTHGAVAFKMSTAVRSRMVHLNLSSNLEDWLDWAVSEGIDHRIVSFLQTRPELLNKFDPSLDDDTYPCERTWDFASRITKGQPVGGDFFLPLLSGTVGQGAATEFIGYCEVYKQLPTFAEIEANPATATVPYEPSATYAVVGMVANGTTKANLKRCLAYLGRLPPEFLVLAMKQMIQNDRTITSTPEYADWLKQNGAAIMGVV